MIPRSTTIILSSGSITPWVIPSEPGDCWPDDAPAHTVFRNTAGAVLADVPADEVDAKQIKYIFRPDGPAPVEAVPAGARFESFITLDDGEFKTRYGVVQRAEARFADLPPSAITPGPRLFSDIFNRSAPGWKWEPVYGKAKIAVDNIITQNPLGLGANVDLLIGFPAAVRFYKPLAGDSLELSVTINMPPAIGVNNGKTTATFCTDQNMTSGLAMQLDSVAGQVHMARLTGHNAFTNLGTAATGITFVNGDSFTARYDNLTDTLSIYRGTNLSPMVTPYTDTLHAVPHGNGYRYLDLAFAPTLLETGPVVWGWSARDGV